MHNETSRKLHYLLTVHWVLLTEINSFKNSSVIYPEVFWITLSYCMCFNEMTTPTLVCWEKQKKQYIFLKTDVVLMYFRWLQAGIHKDKSNNMRKKFFKCLFHIYCIKSFWHAYTTGCGSFQTWFLIKKKKLLQVL